MHLARLPVGPLVTCLVLAVAAGCSSNGAGTSDAARSKHEAAGDSEAAGAAGTSKSATVDSSTAESSTAGGKPGTLAGRVVFTGAVPPPLKIVATKDVEYCGKRNGERQDVVVSDSGGLANVVVEIRGIEEPAEGWNWTRPDEGYVLRQKGCAFDPPLLVIPDGAELHVFNDDPVSHNVNTGQWNVLQAGGDNTPLVRPLSNIRPIRVACNIHSWMESWIYPAKSPFYAVTDEEGAFRIDGVPPGKYRVLAWHPSLRQQRAAVKMPAGETVQQEFAFESPFDG